MSVPAEMIACAHRADIREVAARYVPLKKITTVEFAGPCPAPTCGGTDRFSVNTGKQVFNCRGCGAKGDVISLVMHVEGVSFRGAVERLACKTSTPNRAPASKAPNADKPPAQADADAVRDIKSAARIIAQIVPIVGTDGERYLREARLIDTAAIADVLERTDAIGWHPAVFYNQPDPEKPLHEFHGQRLGAIIAILTDPVTAKPTGAVSRTYLRPDLTKIGKAKSLAGSGIVRLSLDEDVLSGLHLAEGLETALYAMAKGFRPLWSTGSTSLLASFPVLSGIECLTVLADRDRNQAGERAAKAVAVRWREAGREAHILRPRDGLGDLNDIELRRAE